MAVRAQMDQIKLLKLNLEQLELTTNAATTNVLIQSSKKQLALVCPELFIVLQFCVALAM